MRIVKASNGAAVRGLLGVAQTRDAAIERQAATIVERVRAEGDRALRRYAGELDGLKGAIEVPREEWVAAARSLPSPVRRALATAARHIRRIARAQRPAGWRTTVAPGISVEQRVIPLERVGCYVPGGRYPLPSSLLMTAIPARVAGVGEITAVSPRPHPAVLAAALEADVDRFFQVGGAHAIGALAYGTKTVPRVDKIVGPGNRWVAAAKAFVSRDCAIDFYAGPSEIVIISDRGPAEWIAADLIAQAEHDPDARAVLITSNRQLAAEVAASVAQRLPSQGPAATALARYGGIVLADNLEAAMNLANEAAPEHLVVDNDALARRVTRAGSVFVGRWSAQVAGDYAIGSNHVLPTAGAARFRGGLHTGDFVRLVSIQRVSQNGLARLASTVATLARSEGLEAHAQSIDVRIRPRTRRHKRS